MYTRHMERKCVSEQLQLKTNAVSGLMCIPVYGSPITVFYSQINVQYLIRFRMIPKGRWNVASGQFRNKETISFKFHMGSI